ncbi:SSU ribosomal protein S20p [Gracilibacillus boraciitolerans JCM 21714]|uniref:Small ribosomal subunit protein bS20 n=1 Tax=Gracilibacillus boraciitolerans JCM 21714 TaxID=1298598 RepID=W4VD70_9BACI|nr:SSU ribosomal protein S20p [Gracilibacillus boraciitolerans JCM 21714]
MEVKELANIKSAIKRVRTNEDHRLQNQSVKTDMRSHIKKVEALVANKEVENAKAALQTATKKIDKAVQKGLVHQNKGDRQKSRLAKKVNGLSA